jgi:glycosyltransferase involved in cell wall biosynthesis/ADP-heptose:LPS heptosyltransferase
LLDVKPKLLVVELWAVGDLVMATPFLRAASEKYSVTLLAKPHARDLQNRFWPEVEIIPFTAPWTAFEHKYRIYSWPWRDVLRLLRTLSAKRFDLGLSARWDPRDHLLLTLAGVKRRIGFSRAGSRILLNEALEKPAPGSHRYEHWRALANALGLKVPDRKSISLPPPHEGCILVHTGAAQHVRVWPMDRFRNMVGRLRAQGFAVLVACDPNQRDWWIAVGEANVATPRTITELLQLADRAAVLIGNDSGPGHLAAFSGLPTFTIFGPQLPGLFAPVHPASVWIDGAPCPYRPCSDYCHFTVPHCMWDLDEQTVWPRVEEFVSRHAEFIQRVPVEVSVAATNDPAAIELPAATQLRRVLHVNNSADIYGASRMLLRYVQTIDRRRFKPLVVLPEKGLLKDLFEAQGVEVVLHPRLSIITRPVFQSWRIILFFLNFPLSVLFLWRLIRSRRIELVHTNTGVMVSPALAARLAGVPHIWHVRDWFQEFRSFWPALSWYMRVLSRKVVTISNAVATQFEPAGTPLVIHDGLSLEEFQVPTEELRHNFRDRYGLGDHFVVGCVGRIKLVRKGQEVLVMASGILKQRGRRLKALIVGAPFPGNEKHLAQIQEIARELGIAEDVVFTGELADVRPAYAAMDVFALTSIQPEPLGNVAMEAMSMGLPVVAPNVGGPLDTVEPGVTGLLVPPGDAAALADAIEKLMDDPGLRRRMGDAAVARIRKYFTLAEMTAKMDRLFEKTISSTNNGR